MADWGMEFKSSHDQFLREIKFLINNDRDRLAFLSYFLKVKRIFNPWVSLNMILLQTIKWYIYNKCNPRSILQIEHLWSSAKWQHIESKEDMQCHVISQSTSSMNSALTIPTVSFPSISSHSRSPSSFGILWNTIFGRFDISICNFPSVSSLVRTISLIHSP